MRKFDAGSWNLAGVSESDAMAVLSGHVCLDVVLVQEWPKAKPGWRFLSEAGYKGIIFQDALMCRGVGLVYRDSAFRLLRKKSSARGAWFLMRCKKSGKDVWMGSVHQQVSDCNSEYQRSFQEMLASLPGTTAPAVLLGDFNVDFKWSQEVHGSMGVSSSRCSVIWRLLGGSGSAPPLSCSWLPLRGILDGQARGQPKLMVRLLPELGRDLSEFLVALAAWLELIMSWWLSPFECQVNRLRVQSGSLEGRGLFSAGRSCRLGTSRRNRWFKWQRSAQNQSQAGAPFAPPPPRLPSERLLAGGETPLLGEST